MPNDIPAVTGTPQRIPYSVRYIDHTGDKRATAFTGLDPAKVTPALLEALNGALGTASSASAYEAVIGDVFAVVPDKNDADVADRSEVQNQFVVLAKTASGLSENLYIPAPVPACFLPYSDDVDPASTEIAAVLAAWLALLPTGFEVVSIRYTSRSQYNKATPL